MASVNNEKLGRVLVLGMGKTGEGICRYLASLTVEGGRVSSVTLYGGAKSAEGDASRALEALGVRCVLGTEDVRGDYDLAVASPGIPETSAFYAAAAACSAEVIGEPELAFRESPERWLAVTGTNGKTTTTSLTTHLLEAAGMAAESVGNIGVLCIGKVGRRPEGGWLVAELSSFQLAGTRRLRPRAAALLNITPDHIEWHGSMEAYAAAKEKVFANMGAGDLAVVSVDDDRCRAAAARCAARGLRVCELSVEGEPAGADAAFVRGERLVVRLAGAETDLCACSDLRIRGRHNWQNALAASALALFAGAGADEVARGLASFDPIEHRIEPCGEAGGVRFVNDSKATNTDSVEKALTAFPPRSVVVLLGGHDKGTDLTSLAAACCAEARAAVCFGEAGERIARALEDEASREGEGPRVLRAAHLREAFGAAVAVAEPGDTVLLSPACSSFDEFANMGERGRFFKGLVAELCAAEAQKAGE
ncbi:MAG: UDP-N-acetylmuramoyl-L-alanine--D-glutamate ligase [Coriobacteriia bacterium]|nr:UDP-N-acetylmuramoyl-L-alanine--D-glutamate ligase [Coriobacteriia bacterium]